MVKNLLIPTDFRVESLNVLKHALEQCSGHTVNVTLFYAGLPGNTLTDLLFYSQRDILNSLTHPEFEQALAVIRNCYENCLGSLTIQLLQGDHDAALEGLVLRNNISEIYVPRDYRLTEHPGSFNPVPLLKKYPLPVHEVAWTPSVGRDGQNQLSSLFKLFEN